MSKQQGWTTYPMTKQYTVDADCTDYSWEELVLSGCGDQYNEEHIDALMEEYE